MRARTVVLLGAMAMAPPLGAETRVCDTVPLTITADDPTTSARICDIATEALPRLAACNLPLDRAIAIEVVDRVPGNCFGQYHCGEDRIIVLTPDAAAALRRPESLYASLPQDIFFDSVIVHELAHAATDDMPCPFEDCPVGQEYIAYAMQLDALPDDLRAPMIRPDYNRRITRDELNVLFLMMAPDLFAQKAWLHFRQRPDPCAYLGQVADGSVLLDMEHF